MSESPLCIAPGCGGERGPCRTVPGQLLCVFCTTRLRRDIEVTPSLVAWLAQHVAPAAGRGERVSGSRERPVPVRLDVVCMLSEGAAPIWGDDDDQVGPPSIPSTLKNWAWLICEHRGLVYPVRAGVDELAPWLARQVSWCAGQGWVGEMAAEMGRLRRTAHALAPWLVQVDYLIGPCHTCDLRALAQVAGEAYIECDRKLGGCGSLWSAAEYHAHVTEIVVTHPATRATMLAMTRRHPGRLPPKEQRELAEKQLITATEQYLTAKQAADAMYEQMMAEPTASWHAAIKAAAGPPSGVLAAEKKSLVTRARMREITGLGTHSLQDIVNGPAGS